MKSCVHTFHCNYCKGTIKWDEIPYCCPMCGAHMCERERIKQCYS